MIAEILPVDKEYFCVDAHFDIPGHTNEPKGVLAIGAARHYLCEAHLSKWVENESYWTDGVTNMWEVKGITGIIDKRSIIDNRSLLDHMKFVKE